MKHRINLANTDIAVSPLCLGGNVFGWSADERTSKAVLSAYAAHGGNFVDTADVYSEWMTGNSGGESETIIGNWLQESGNRDRMVIATKVTKYAKRPGLGASNIKPAAPLDITDDITFSLGFGGANGAIDTLILQRCEERFSGGVNPNTPRFCPSRIACPAH
jgi:aryl-alcohol dehydrogenase-like predicted oxidoreductase